MCNGLSFWFYVFEYFYSIALRKPLGNNNIRIRDFILIYKENLPHISFMFPSLSSNNNIRYFFLPFIRNTHPSVSIRYFFLLSHKRIIKYFFSFNTKQISNFISSFLNQITFFPLMTKEFYFLLFKRWFFALVGLGEEYIGVLIVSLIRNFGLK